MKNTLNLISTLYPNTLNQNKILQKFGFYKAIHLLQPLLANTLVKKQLNKLSSTNLINNNELIPNLTVSLTSYPPRINALHLTIKTLLLQTIKPENLILYLAIEDFPQKDKQLPETLLDLQQIGLQIQWVNNHRSYDKLIHALQHFPKHTIVTADDDIFYPSFWLETLYNHHLNAHNHVLCHRAHRIKLSPSGKILPYQKWQKCTPPDKPSSNLLFTGCGGVLYPPGSLHKDVINKELFLKYAPNADDIWFWAMAIRNNTQIQVVPNNIMDAIPVSESQSVSLFRENITQNNTQLNNILNAYPEIYQQILKEDSLYNEP